MEIHFSQGFLRSRNVFLRFQEQRDTNSYSCKHLLSRESSPVDALINIESEICRTGDDDMCNMLSL